MVSGAGAGAGAGAVMGGAACDGCRGQGSPLLGDTSHEIIPLNALLRPPVPFCFELESFPCCVLLCNYDFIYYRYLCQGLVVCSKYDRYLGH